VTIADDELYTFATNLINDLDAILFGRTIYQLFQDYWLLVHSVILGKREHMLDGQHNMHNLKLADTQTFNSGVVVLHYQAVQNKKIKAATR
jgi:hypothetical protein